MFSPAYICICIYCMLQLGFFIFIGSHRNNINAKQYLYFLWMLRITFFSFIANIISSIHTDSNFFFPFAAGGNYLEIILNTSLVPIYYLYVCDQIYNLDSTLKQRVKIILFILASVCSLLVISTAFTGKIFYFDKYNVYHRGPLFALPMVLFLIMIIIIEVFLIMQKRKIEAHYYRSLLLFLLSPLIGLALQFLIYGLPFSLLGITFASLILFTNIQNRNIDKDYLTGVFNRQTLDTYMQRKINASTNQKTFSAIMLDIDDFKSINDRFGHFEGDTAIINTVKILRDSLRFTDFIARYGGDEFCIIIDSDDRKTIKNTITLINNNLARFNKNEDKQYSLSFSIGYAIYNISFGKKSEQFFKVIDENMYEVKNAGKFVNI